MSKIILHIDLNAFFATCEEIKNPSLVGKPLVVGGDGRRGIVSTCNYEARKYGIHSGMPTFQAKMLCKTLIICPGDGEYYSLMSKEFINHIKSFTSKVEQMSIDECFADITDTFKRDGKGDILSYLKKIQDGLYEKTKLKCSIGVATTKFLAKMASDMKKPMGITIIRNKDIKKMIFPLSIRDYFGIGKQSYARYEKSGVHTIGDLYYGIKNNDPVVTELVGSFKDSIINHLEGNSSDEILMEFPQRQSIGVTRTLMADSNDRVDIKHYYMKLAEEVIDDMKHKGFLTKTITAVYKDAVHDESFHSRSASKSLKDYTDDKVKILEEASTLFDKSYDDALIRMVGFTVKNLKERKDVVVQMTFDNYEQNEVENSTQLLINELNRELNSNTFIRLSDLEKKK